MAEQQDENVELIDDEVIALYDVTNNPVDFEEAYLLQCARYAVSQGVTHFQFIGPIHDPVKGNIDGMVFYRKYAQFNAAKKDLCETGSGRQNGNENFLFLQKTKRQMSASTEFRRTRRLFMKSKWHCKERKKQIGVKS